MYDKNINAGFQNQPSHSTTLPELSHEKIHLTKCSEMITPKKTIKLAFHGLFCNSLRSAKSNTVTELRTKKNTVYELKFCCKNKCIYM